MLLVKTCLLATEIFLTYAVVTQQPFGNPSCNLGTCIFVTSSIFHHIVVSTSFGLTLIIRCGCACHWPCSNDLCLGNEHKEFHSPRLVECEMDFPNPQQELIGSNQLWRICTNLILMTPSYKVLVPVSVPGQLRSTCTCTRVPLSAPDQHKSRVWG